MWISLEVTGFEIGHRTLRFQCPEKENGPVSGPFPR
jgi:hypothetical protein